ncbi:MAG: hypothetical protein ACOX5M_03040 [Bacillota bacterium]|jgi:hypothetical protein
MSGNTYTDANKILWADIGERLGLDKNALRDFRKTFSDVLGLDVSHPSVSPDMVPVLERVQFVRQQGIPDDMIRENVSQLTEEAGWPDEVLARMQQAAETARSSAAEATETAEARCVPPVVQPDEEAPANDSEPASSYTPAASHAHAAFSVRESPHALPSLSEATLREILLDLRREIATGAVSERELVLHLMQQVRRLTLEVRDLRYAFLLASSRKDRKKGIKAISRLLSG